MRILTSIFLLFNLTFLFGQNSPYRLHKKLSTWGTGLVMTGMNKISFTKDEKYLAAGTADAGYDNVLIWNVDSGKVFKNLSHTGKKISVYDLCFSPDGKYLISVGTFHPHKGIKIWKTSDFSVLKEITYDTIEPYTLYNGSYFPRTVLTGYCTSDSKYFITADDDGIIKVWRTADWTLNSTVDIHAGQIGSIQGTNDGKKILTAGSDGFVRVWNFNVGNLVLRDSIRFSDRALANLAISPNNISFSTNTNDSLRIINIRNHQTEKTIAINDSLDYFVISVDFHCTGKYFASGHAANNAKLWSLETDEILQDLKGDRNNPDQNESETDIFCKVKFSPSGKYLAMCNDVGFIYLFKSN